MTPGKTGSSKLFRLKVSSGYIRCGVYRRLLDDGVGVLGTGHSSLGLRAVLN